MRLSSVCTISLFLLLSLPVWSDEGHHHELSSAQLGAISFPISCAPAEQKEFEQGVAWLHSFEYEQAGKLFDEIKEHDPKCAMAYWGRAMTHYHQLWARPNKASIAKASALLQMAAKLKSTPREREYIAALSIFYASDDEKTFDKRVKDYSDAMDRLRQQNPQDREAAVFYALSLLSQDSDGDPTLANARKAIGILNELLKSAPAHPGITHYIIHATDNPELASLGLAAAREYAKIAPVSPHAVHMPSHIFARLGLWQDSIKSNLAALAAADAMDAMGMNMSHHRVHSMDFLQYAYLQIGDDRNAKAQLDTLRQIPRASLEAEYMNFFDLRKLTFAANYALERRQWKEALQIPEEPQAPAWVQAVTYWTRAVAAGHLRDAKLAKAAADRYLELMEETKKSPKAYLAKSMESGRDEALAWQKHAEGSDEEAVKLLRAVADKEAKVGKGETDLPAREMLADLLLESGRAEEALQEYELALKTDPNRFNGLLGAAHAAEQTKQPEKAAQFYQQLLKNCEGVESDRPELAQAKQVVSGL